jgi:hypothetical protein
MVDSTNGGTPIAGWFISWKNPTQIDDLGGPHFRKPPYSNIYRKRKVQDGALQVMFVGL